jgi:hypothetical protein
VLEVSWTPSPSANSGRLRPLTSEVLSNSVGCVTPPEPTCRASSLYFEAYVESQNEARCKTLSVGAGPLLAGKTFRVEPGYTCPEVVNRDNWVGGETWPDTFAVTQAFDAVSVARTDTGDASVGWGMDLQFECCRAALTTPLTTLADMPGVFDAAWGDLQPDISIREMHGDMWYANDPDFAASIPGFSESDGYIMRWRGQIEIEVGGDYTFSTESDDGSMLYIDEQLVVDNDGIHAMRAMPGSVMLDPGEHDVTVTYFENTGDAGLKVSWTPRPGMDLVRLSSNALSNTVRRTRASLNPSPFCARLTRVALGQVCPCGAGLYFEAYTHAAGSFETVGAPLAQTAQKFGGKWDAMHPVRSFPPAVALRLPYSIARAHTTATQFSWPAGFCG